MREPLRAEHSSSSSDTELGHQTARLPEIIRVEALSEPAVDRVDKGTGPADVSPIPHQPPETHRRAQLVRPRALAARELEGLLEASLRIGGLTTDEQQLALQPPELGLVEAVEGRLGEAEGLLHGREPLVGRP